MPRDKDPAVEKWLDDEHSRAECEAQEADAEYMEIDAAREQYRRTGTLPREVRSRFNREQRDS